LTLGVGEAGSGSEREETVAESAGSLEIVIAAGGFSTTFAVPSICGTGQSNKIVANNMMFSSGVAALDAVPSESTCLQHLNFTAHRCRSHWPLGHISGGTRLWESGLRKEEPMY
jgi:hypothetical protein